MVVLFRNFVDNKTDVVAVGWEQIFIVFHHFYLFVRYH